MKLPIYLDAHATTPVDPRVLEAMLPFFTDTFGNSASRNHSFGWQAEEAVDRAREQVAHIIGADPKEIVVTSGSTESNNLAIKGVAEFYREKGNHIITCATEHKAVIDPCTYLREQGSEVTFLPVDEHGSIDYEQLKAAITERTILISIMAANNEIGTIHDTRRIGAIAKKHNVLFHCDATQAVGKYPIDVNDHGIDLLSLSAHKLYGPKGVGCLYVRRRSPRVRLSPILHGGGHERGMRSGTLNVPGIVGLGKACEIAESEIAAGEPESIRALRDRLESGIRRELDEVKLNGHPSLGLDGNLNLSFAFVEGESLIMGIPDVAVSSGSACTSASLEPSYVLKALGVGEDLAHSSIRFGIHRFTTEEAIDFTINQLVNTVKRLRDMSPLYEMHKEGIDLKSVKWQAH